ncbi:CCA tRNA nucleotidyltransferase [Cohnella endophytica]|uniref:CCA tRNA nucleotidyltransferase n=1 Tax=Cohnella endophytica TaxID=2419778 RepID=A0A494Y2U8_9BACL|nr:CCA tRNA nucleotidyltransferase [Cohnella endophytica]RKP57024.1 CCA tRNA nucleotidyltransferase [Cohnella endophytica]
MFEWIEENDIVRDEDPWWIEGLELVRKLERSGYQAYLVGGSVRDRLMGRPLHDVDIATSAKPEEVMVLFEKTLPTGLQHGTVTVMEGGRAFEITTFRQETGYSDARRPDSVTFVHDVRDDLARRDFTFNAMAFGSDGTIVDPYGGQDALRAGVVQCVGNATERFGEDALRMLRAIRFAAEFEFELLPDVWQAIIGNRAKLRQVAIERVSSEWDKMMAGRGPEQACHYLFKSGLLGNLKEEIPDAVVHAAEQYRLNSLSWEWDKWGGAFSASADGLQSQLANLPLLIDPDLRWTALLCGMGISEEDGRLLCRALRLSGKRAERIAGVVGMNEQIAAYDEEFPYEGWTYAVLDYGRAVALDWLVMTGAWDTVSADERSEWLAQLPVTSVSELNVRGDELANELGRRPGPWLAEMLLRLLEEVAFGEVPNEKLALLEAARTDMESEGYDG